MPITEATGAFAIVPHNDLAGATPIGERLGFVRIGVGSNYFILTGWGCEVHLTQAGDGPWRVPDEHNPFGGSSELPTSTSLPPELRNSLSGLVVSYAIVSGGFTRCVSAGLMVWLSGLACLISLCKGRSQRTPAQHSRYPEVLLNQASSHQGEERWHLPYGWMQAVKWARPHSRL